MGEWPTPSIPTDMKIIVPELSLAATTATAKHVADKTATATGWCVVGIF